MDVDTRYCSAVNVDGNLISIFLEVAVVEVRLELSGCSDVM
jgi:hypothetical protein